MKSRLIAALFSTIETSLLALVYVFKDQPFDMKTTASYTLLFQAGNLSYLPSFFSAIEKYYAKREN